MPLRKTGALIVSMNSRSVAAPSVHHTSLPAMTTGRLASFSSRAASLMSSGSPGMRALVR